MTNEFWTSTHAGLLALLALPAAADTIVVDDDGGPGVDYVDVQAAIDGAQDQDVLLVQAGSYPGFTIQGKRLTLVGQGTVDVQGLVSIRQQAKRCELSSLTLPALSVEKCSAPIFLDALTIVEDLDVPVPAFVRIDQCADVRMRDSTVAGNDAWSLSGTGTDALHVLSSRFEASSCTIVASSGSAGTTDPAGDGGRGALLGGAARFHCAGVVLTGAEGGTTTCLGTNEALPHANGGWGLVIDPTSTAIATGGPAHFIAGGGYGKHWCSVGNGAPGVASWNDGFLRLSSLGTPSGLNTGQQTGGSGALVLPAPDDPWLEVVGSPANGSFDAVLRIHGSPGDAARINLGRVPIVVDTPGVAVELLVGTLRTVALGTIPASGTIDYPWPQLGFFPTGTPFVAQGVTVLPTGEVRRTNSAPIVVR